MRQTALVLLVMGALLMISTAIQAQVEQGGPGGAAPSVAAPGNPPAGPEGGPGPGAGRGRGMMRLDTNNDGVISQDEWRGPQEAFKSADTNGDGKIDSVEMAAMRERFQGMRRNRGNIESTGETGPARRRARNQSDEVVFDTQVRNAGRIETLLFRMMDANNDGKITKQELDDFSTRLLAADNDKDGAVSAEEARKAAADKLAERFSERFMKQYDKDNDGKVTAAELGDNADEFKALDANGDGAITSADFTAVAEKGIEEVGPRPGRGPEGIGPRPERGFRQGRGRGQGGPQGDEGPGAPQDNPSAT